MKSIITIVLFLYTSAFSQTLNKSELDSLFNLYLKIKNPVVTEARTAADTIVSKCGFAVVNSVRLNFDKFTNDQQLVLLKMFQRPTSQKEAVTPSGYFRIHYDTSGTNTLKYDLNLLMQSLDSSYSFEVVKLGYLPPKDNGTGGDDKYDVYVRNVGSLYGYTEIEDRIYGNTYNSFMVLDNEYSHTHSKGIDGARVTVAHELHHGIQIGNYAFSDQDIYFHELSSTAMEEFVYDDINDYYNYMDDYFGETDICMTEHNGYDLAIWNIFLESIFDYNILKKQWEVLSEKRAIDAIVFSIGERGANFQDVYNKFGIWTYFTGHRASPGKYFEEGAQYPVVSNLIQKRFTPPADTLVLNAYPVSHNYITLSNTINLGTDTLTILISNSDYKRATVNPVSAETAVYELYVDSSDGLSKISDGYYKRFTVQNTAFWAASEFLNNQLVSEGFIRIESESAFPLPFRYNVHSLLYFPVKMNPDKEVELNIYSASMDLVYNSTKAIFNMFGKDIVSWNGRTTENRKLGSGVYLYVIKSGDDIVKGKLIIFND